MEGNVWYGYTKGQWVKLIACYLIFFFFGAIESSQSVYYSVMKNELAIPYNVQGFLVSMTSWSFILGSPLVGYIMTLVDVKPIIIAGYAAYSCAYSALLGLKVLWCVFISLFVEGLGGVLLDNGINTLSTVLFTQHRGVMMNYLHFFYGAGCVLGPLYSSWFMSAMKMGYRGAFVGLLVFCAIGLLLTITCKLSLKTEMPPKEEEAAVLIPEDKPALTIWKSFITPMVWLLGINMGAVCAIESITMNWAPLYLQYLYHIDPKEGGAHFIALFYVFYTLARLVTGFVVDRVGDELSMILFNVLLIAWYLLCFFLGKRGVWLLTFTGFFISPFYPTALSVAMHAFGAEAKNTISVILCFSNVVSLVVQVVIGFVNEYISPEWGYPVLSIATSCVIILCMLLACFWLKKHPK